VNELERVEAQALRDAVTLSGGRAEMVGGALCVAQPVVPVDIFNRALPIAEHVDLAAIEAWFDTDHVVAVTPEREGLARELSARGYANGDAWMKFERLASPAPPVGSELSVEETFDRDALRTVADDSGFGVMWPIEDGIIGAPGWRFFLARAGSTPAGSAAMYMDGTTAWLGISATRPAFRGRGGQTALLAARIERARELGATLLVTETDERVPGRPSTSYGNILRAGFREAYLRANWGLRRT
jgi:GNAT superfamily N-acetyltransferase